jgi:hypothetical protein
MKCYVATALILTMFLAVVMDFAYPFNQLFVQDICLAESAVVLICGLCVACLERQIRDKEMRRDIEAMERQLARAYAEW